MSVFPTVGLSGPGQGRRGSMLDNFLISFLEKHAARANVAAKKVLSTLDRPKAVGVKNICLIRFSSR